jgi:hypothetical protein
MVVFLVVKKLGALHPVDEAGTDALRAVAHGEIVEVTIRRPRNVRHHRLFWAMAGLVWNQLDHQQYPTVEHLVTRIKIAVGHSDRLEFEGGIVAFIPRSIAFHKMDQVEFSAFYERVCDYVAESILPGVTRADLKDEVERMIGVRD